MTTEEMIAALNAFSALDLDGNNAIIPEEFAIKIQAKLKAAEKLAQMCELDDVCYSALVRYREAGK